MCIRNRNKNLFPAEARRHISAAHNQKAKAKTRLVLNMVGKTKHHVFSWLEKKLQSQEMKSILNFCTVEMVYCVFIRHWAYLLIWSKAHKTDIWTLWNQHKDQPFQKVSSIPLSLRIGTRLCKVECLIFIIISIWVVSHPKKGTTRSFESIPSEFKANLCVRSDVKDRQRGKQT